MENPDEFQLAMKEISRMRIWTIWQSGKLGAELDDEEARLYNVLLEHPEHVDLWDRLDRASDDDVLVDGVNVVLHVTIHTIAENQLAENNPPAVRDVLRVLLQKGLGRHEAIHAIGNALIMEIFTVQRENRPYDERRYLRELRKLPLQAAGWRKKKK